MWRAWQAGFVLLGAALAAPASFAQDCNLCGSANPARADKYPCDHAAADPCNNGWVCANGHWSDPGDDDYPSLLNHPDAGRLCVGEGAYTQQRFCASKPAACTQAPVEPPACNHGEACDSWGAHETSDHACASCDDRDGTCGWHRGHRHPGQCANDPNWRPPEVCTCCAGVNVTKDPNRTCEQECDSLTRQITDACPVVDPPAEPPVSDPPADPEVDELGCHDNPPHPFHNGCPGPNVVPGHDCASREFHRHEDAFEGECHSEDFQHGYVGCGLRRHQHDDLECHDESVHHDGSGSENGGGVPGTGVPTPGGSTPGGSTPGGSTPGGSTPGGSTPGGSSGGGSVGSLNCAPGLAYVCRDGSVACSPLGCRPVEQASFACLGGGVRLWNEQCSGRPPCGRGWRYTE